MGIEMALLATTALGAVSAIGQGQQQKKMYELQAGQAQLEAQAQITDRTRALNEAMATQNAMIGASGRTLSSISSVIKGNEKRYKQDVELIKSGSKSQSEQYKMAGKASQTQGITSAISTAGTGAFQYSMLKG